MFKEFAVKKEHSQKWFIRCYVLKSKHKVSLLRTSSGYFSNHSLTFLTKHFTASALRYCNLYCVILICAEVFVAVTQRISFVLFFWGTAHFSRRRLDINNLMQKYYTVPDLKGTATQTKKGAERLQHEK